MEGAQLHLTGHDQSELDTLQARLGLRGTPDLLLLFGDVARLSDTGWIAALQRCWPQTPLAGCSTAGHLMGNQIASDGAVLTALRFDRAQVRVHATPHTGLTCSFPAGQKLGQALLANPPAPLRGVILLAPGVNIHGSALIDGLETVLPPDVVVAGGLAGDGGAFEQTWVLGPEGSSATQVVAIGLYGDVQLSQAAYGGWKPFGMARRATRADGPRLYELDGEPALELYRRYLGPHAQDLPASGLLFPFEVLDAALQPTGLVRTILGVDNDDGSLLLAGDIPPGAMLRLMYANTDALVDGAQTAAEHVAQALQQVPDFALLVSCVGRKLVMGERVEEELEAVEMALRHPRWITGFYSYGEIAPLGHDQGTVCCLNNQTMTVLALREAT